MYLTKTEEKFWWLVGKAVAKVIEDDVWGWYDAMEEFWVDEPTEDDPGFLEQLWAMRAGLTEHPKELARG